jgi:hypothetical protein
MERPPFEAGKVHYFTTFLYFPQDKDEWVRQEPIPGSTAHSIFNYIAQKDIPDAFKVRLCQTLEASWKDSMGVWIKVKIETQRRNTRWGNLRKVKK